MPEGPEAEITARALHTCLAGRTLAVTHLDGTRLADAADLDATEVVSVHRAGKWVGFAHGTGTTWVHMGMSGRFVIARSTHRLDHARLALATTDLGPVLYTTLIDPRRFSRAHTGPVPPGPELGPDVLEDPQSAAGNLTGRRRGAKALLLDPSVIAGVGNYLADEALHRAGVHPAARHLDGPAASALASAAGDTARSSLAAGGMSMRDWAAPDGTRGRMLERCSVFRRAPGPCPGCGTALRTARIASRTTTWCPRCQPVTAPGKAEDAPCWMWPPGDGRGRWVT